MILSEKELARLPDHLQRLFVKLPNPGSEEVLAEFPETQSAIDHPRHNGEFKSVAKGHESAHTTFGHSDSGSAARFFYTAKADSDERIGSKHPTVKPLDLMQWLVRLVTPKSTWFCFECEGNNNAARKHDVRSMQHDIHAAQTERPFEQVLQPSMRLAEPSSSTDAMRMVRDNLSAEEGRREEILQQDMFEQGSGTKTIIDKGLCNDQQGLQDAAHADTSSITHTGRIHFRTPLGDGATNRTDVDDGRSCSSHQRNQGRQPAGESSFDVEARARRFEFAKAEHAQLSALRWQDRDQPTCPHCQSKLLLQRGKILDCFAGTGTTGEAAWREGMRCVLIEREDQYCTDIARRMELALAGPVERVGAIVKAKDKDIDLGPLFGGKW